MFFQARGKEEVLGWDLINIKEKKKKEKGEKEKKKKKKKILYKSECNKISYGLCVAHPLAPQNCWVPNGQNT